MCKWINQIKGKRISTGEHTFTHHWSAFRPFTLVVLHLLCRLRQCLLQSRVSTDLVTDIPFVRLLPEKCISCFGCTVADCLYAYVYLLHCGTNIYLIILSLSKKCCLFPLTGAEPCISLNEWSQPIREPYIFLLTTNQLWTCFPPLFARISLCSKLGHFRQKYCGDFFPLSFPQVSVQQVIPLLMVSVHASSVRWAPTSQNQAGSSASPVEEVSWPSTKDQSPSGTVKPKVRLCVCVSDSMHICCMCVVYCYYAHHRISTVYFDNQNNIYVNISMTSVHRSLPMHNEIKIYYSSSSTL